MATKIDIIQDKQGNAVKGATVQALQNGVAQPLYADDGVTSIGSSVTTDALGQYRFTIAGGVYDLLATFPSGITNLIPGVQIFDESEGQVVYTGNIATVGKNNPSTATNILGASGTVISTFEVNLVAEASGASPAQQALAALVSLGFTTGLRNDNSNPKGQGKIWYGGEVLNANPSEWVTVEAYFFTDYPYNWGFPRAYLMGEDRTVIILPDESQANFPMLSANRVILNAYVAKYTVTFQIPDGAEVYEIVAGSFAHPNDPNADPLVWPKIGMAGLRYSVDPNNLAMRAGDWGGSNRLLDAVRMLGKATGPLDILVDDTIHSIEGTPFNLYVTSMLPLRTLGADGRMLIQNAGVDTGGPPLLSRGQTVLEFDPDKALGEVELLYVAETGGNDNLRNGVAKILNPVDGSTIYPAIAHVKTTQASLYGKTALVQCLGDSLIDVEGMFHAMVRAAASSALNVTITGVGTLLSDERIGGQPTPTTGVFVITDSRTGWRAGDIAGMGGDPVASYNGTAPTRMPLPAGQETAYAAMNQAQRRQYGVHLRNPVIGDTDFIKQHAWKMVAGVEGGDNTLGYVVETAPLNYYDEVAAGHSPDPSEYWVFDLEYARTRFAATSIGTLDIPDVLFLALGTNDLTDWVDGINTVDPLTYIRALYEIVAYQVANTSGWEDTRLIISIPNCSTNDGGRSRWVLQQAWITLALQFKPEAQTLYPSLDIAIADLWARVDPLAIYYALPKQALGSVSGPTMSIDTKLIDSFAVGDIVYGTGITAGSTILSASGSSFVLDRSSSATGSINIYAVTPKSIPSGPLRSVEIVHHMKDARAQAGQAMLAVAAPRIATNSGGSAIPVDPDRTAAVIAALAAQHAQGLAENARDEAQAYAANASGTWVDEATGRANSADGQGFFVHSSTIDSAFDYYTRTNSSTSVLVIAGIPNPYFDNTTSALITRDWSLKPSVSADGIIFANDAGDQILFPRPNVHAVDQSIISKYLTVTINGDATVSRLRNPAGDSVPLATVTTTSSGGGGGDVSGTSEALIQAQEARAQGYSAAVPDRPLPAVAGLWWDYVLHMGYGQSRNVGGASPLPKTVAVPSFGVTAKMVGYSTRASSENNTYVAFDSVLNGDTGHSVGAFTFRDAIATTDIDKPGGGGRYDYTTLVISPTSGHNGEAPTVGSTYELWSKINDSRNEYTGNFGGRIPIISVEGFGGETLASLTSDSNMPGTSFSAKLRMENFLTQLNTYVTSTLGKTLGMASCELVQGEADGATATVSSYKANLATWQSMIYSDCASLLSQTVKPLLTITQIGEHWTSGLPAVPQAQHDFAMEQRDAGVYIDCPSFATPGKFQIPASGLPSTTDMTSTTLNEHKDGNGYRWLGAYRAKVIHRILWERKNWEHMHVIYGAWRTGTNVAYVSWHCPVGPIQILECFIGYRRRILYDKGIKFWQNGLQITFTDMRIVGQTIVFTLDQVPVSGSDVTIDVGNEYGRHNIADSDPAVSKFLYQHSHQDFAAADPVFANMTAQEIAINNEVISELGMYFDAPYPLQNRAAIETFTLEETA